MNRTLSNLLAGAGSILELMPPPTSSTLSFAAKSAEDSMADVWEQVGADLCHAMAFYGLPVEMDPDKADDDDAR